MTWFKVDDQFWGHPKQTALPKGAVCLWVRAGSWSANLLTNGFVPAHMVAMLGCTKGDAKALVAAELWEEAEDGYQFHDWNVYQPTREQVEEKREEEARRKAEWRRKKAAQRAASQSRPEDVPPGHDGDKDVSPASVPDMSRSSRPDPTRPDPSSSKEEDEELLLSDESDAPDPFIEFWKAYPRKTQKRDAEKAYRRALKRASAERILEGLKRYPFNPDRTFQPQAERWLNGDRWVDTEGGGQAPLFDTSKLPEPGVGWSTEQLDMVLGKDTWTVPDPPAGMGDDDGYMWQQREIRKHRLERIKAACAAVGREFAA